ncbi:MAG: hypothetical protein LBP67_06415 [Bacteroidales bacterium]|jgi:hypothetical protein|nr:hypothetical protein [Bacteroidales bacterium]
MKTILGIRRSHQFSPNHIGNDSKIFNITAAELEKKGFAVRQMTEEEFYSTDDIQDDIIFSMIRSIENVNKLKQLEANGIKVINSGKGIENCFRANMTTLLLNNGIPYPKSYIISTEDNPKDAFDGLGSKNIWIKRGDFHTLHKEDIAFCRHCEEGEEILNEYAVRGIPNAVLSEHLWGDLVKFYAVKNTPFFYWFYPFDANHLMFGAQKPEHTSHFDFDISELRSIAEKAAAVLDVDIYGGDAIISKENKIQLIDVNDWPSFAPCRNEAGKHIADAIKLKVAN